MGRWPRRDIAVPRKGHEQPTVLGSSGVSHRTTNWSLALQPPGTTIHREITLPQPTNSEHPVRCFQCKHLHANEFIPLIGLRVVANDLLYFLCTRHLVYSSFSPLRSNRGDWTVIHVSLSFIMAWGSKFSLSVVRPGIFRTAVPITKSPGE
jgi:hypothetical protein